jgi:hypothetical protein
VIVDLDVEGGWIRAGIIAGRTGELKVLKVLEGCRRGVEGECEKEKRRKGKRKKGKK